MSNAVLALLGLARRAGRLTWQKEASLAAIRSGRARLVIVAGDAGRSAAKMYQDKCLTYGIPLVRFATRDELGRALGTSPRTAATVLDPGLADKISGLLGQSAEHI